MSFGTTTYFYDRNNYKGCQQLQLWDNKILIDLQKYTLKGLNLRAILYFSKQVPTQLKNNLSFNVSLS